MQKNVKKRIQVLIEEVNEGIDIIDKHNFDDEINKTYKSRGQYTLVFKNNEAYDKYLLLIEDFHSDQQLNQNYTLKELENFLLDNLIQQNLPEDIIEEILDIDKKEYEYFIPIYGAKISEKLELDDITFMSKCDMPKDLNEKLGVELDDLNEVYANLAIKSYSKKRGYELAKAKVNSLLHIFSFFISPFNDRIKLSTTNDITTFTDTIILNGGGITHLSSREGQVIPMNLEYFRTLDDKVFERLLELNKLDGLNEIEQRVLQSIYWLGESYLHKEIQYKFVNVITAIEAIIQTRNLNLNAMAEMIAFILEDEYSNRVSLIKKFKKLYNIRSRIVHGDSTEVQYTMLRDAYMVAKSLTRWFVENDQKITNMDELDAFVKVLKFS